MSPKRILFSSIEKTEVKEPSLLRGKWRIQGTDDFRTWYPADSFRFKRDKIFLITYKNKWMRSAITVENSNKVMETLKKKELIK
jgi:hypothetical protein